MSKPMLYVVAGFALVGILLLRGWAGARDDAREQRERADTAEHALQVATSANSTFRALHAKANRALVECVGNWDVAQRAGVAAAQDAQAARQQLQRAQDEFERRWSERSQGCGASLLAMQAACAADIGSF